MEIVIAVLLLAFAGFLWWRLSRCKAQDGFNVPRFHDEPEEK